ncbi:hypothetical protein [Sutcliffiella sp. NC1]|uniref:hypothetical protein n=1 Tax=Sutcliffiella sp. NC1 TaxID=3004096 RepID=UPI0022DD589B|nr:hypothetical protein [Sutcliffiella sp. NC1]WBL16449.1 hypothetical protein O1A01_07405 [Sutcliffiella sp. NC1]
MGACGTEGGGRRSMIENENSDFLFQLVVNTLDQQGYYSTVVSPVLTNGNSIAVMTMPSNNYEHYYDGSYRQGYAFQVMTKHESQLVAYNTLLDIAKFLPSLKDIPSQNGSYQFEGIRVTTDPNVIAKDDKYYIFAAQFSAALFIESKE